MTKLINFRQLSIARRARLGERCGRIDGPKRRLVGNRRIHVNWQVIFDFTVEWPLPQTFRQVGAIRIFNLIETKRLIWRCSSSVSLQWDELSRWGFFFFYFIGNRHDH